MFRIKIKLPIHQRIQEIKQHSCVQQW